MQVPLSQLVLGVKKMFFYQCIDLLNLTLEDTTHSLTAPRALEARVASRLATKPPLEIGRHSEARLCNKFIIHAERGTRKAAVRQTKTEELSQ